MYNRVGCFIGLSRGPDSDGVNRTLLLSANSMSSDKA